MAQFPAVSRGHFPVLVDAVVPDPELAVAGHVDQVRAGLERVVVPLVRGFPVQRPVRPLGVVDVRPTFRNAKYCVRTCPIFALALT